MTTGGGTPEGGDAGAGVSLGKGAWDCDRNCKIPPEKEVIQSSGSCFVTGRAHQHGLSAFCVACGMLSSASLRRL